MLLGLAFKGQNVAFMVGLTFAVAASANFPPLLMSIVWRRFNTTGAVCAIVTGAVSVGGAHRRSVRRSGSTSWATPAPSVPLRNPAIVSMTAAFIAGVVGSLVTREARAEAMFESEKLRVYLGVGAE